MAEEGKGKRKRAWSVFSFFKKRKVSEEKEEQEEEQNGIQDGQADLVQYVLQDDLDGLKKHVFPPPLSEDKSAHDRDTLANDNPLYVAARVNRPEAARVLLVAGWKIADDRTALLPEDPFFPAYTPLGIALEKKNDVLGIFFERIVSLEEKGLPSNRKLKRSWSTRKVIARNPSKSDLHSAAKEEDIDLVNLVLEDNAHELERVAHSPPKLETTNVVSHSYAERQEFATDNPLFVAAKIGREKCAEILLVHGWKITEDRTAIGQEDLNIPAFTPLGIAYEKKNGVLDIFLNHILSLEVAHSGSGREENSQPVQGAGLED